MTNTAPVVLAVDNTHHTPNPVVLAVLGEYPDPNAVKIVRSWAEAEQLSGDRGLTYDDEELPQIEGILGKR